MILLGFDVEEFDLPLEYGKSLSLDQQLAISTHGTLLVLALLKETGIKATFYCTANYAINKPDVILKIVAEGHEIASHGYYHSVFETAHLKQSKDILEIISKTQVTGYRMARMSEVDEFEIRKAGYTYNSSINPTYLPGRYNNLNKPRSFFFENNILQIPASVSPVIRFPLFWLTFHNLNLSLIKWMSTWAHRKDGYLNLYFHPWEFSDLKDQYGLPGYITRNSGSQYLERIRNYVVWAQQKGYEFVKTCDFAAAVYEKQNRILE